MSGTEDPSLMFYNSSQTCGYVLTIEGKSETGNVKYMLETLMQDLESVQIFQQNLGFLWDVAYN
jgi:hypothetical protein